MSNFTFSLPNGELFELSGDADLTVAQAEKIFLEQLAAGSLVGFRPGDTLESAESKLIQFNLSRLDRGTAGTADLPLLAINNDGIISALPVLAQEPVISPINTADYTAQAPVLQPIGPLTPTQVQALKSQIAASVCQRSSEISQEKGIGRYGFNSSQLEKAGYVKPGTACRYMGQGNTPESQALPNPENFVSVMSSPAVWTGKDGISRLDNLLDNSAMQDKIQEQLMQTSYQEFVETGQIRIAGAENIKPVGQVYTQPSISSIELTDIGVSGLSDSNVSLSTYRSSVLSETPPGPNTGATAYQTAGSSSSGFSSIAQALAIGSGVYGTLTALSSSSLVKNLLGSSSNVLGNISNLNFGSLSSLGNINLGSLSNLSLSGIEGSLSGAIGSISGLANRGISELGGLIGSASKFGVDTATQWAKGLLPGNLTSQINALTKQGQFAINFSDFKLPSSIGGVLPAAGFSNTTNRQTVDFATSKLIGTTKIPTPGFSGPSIDLSAGALSNQASSLLKSAGSIGGLLNQATGNLGGITSGLQNSLGSLNPLSNSSMSGIKIGVPGVPGSLTSIAGTSGVNLLGTSTTDPGVTAGATSKTIDLEARQAAIDDMELKKGIYEVAKAEYGISSSQAQDAFAAYKAALANLNNFA